MDGPQKCHLLSASPSLSNLDVMFFFFVRVPKLEKKFVRYVAVLLFGLDDSQGR